MEVGQQVTEAGERSETMSAPHDIPVRHSAPPLSSTGTLEGSHQSPYGSNPIDAARRSTSDVWAGAISRLQVQVQLNTSMLEQNRQKHLELESSIQALHGEMNGIRNSLHDVHAELRSRSNNNDQRRHDPRDLEVLAQQVEVVTNKANEVDGLRMQLNLLQNTMRRLEDHGSPAVSALRPGTGSTHRDASFRESIPPPPSAISHPASNAPLHGPLPPMRTASMSSPNDSRPTSLPGPHSGPHSGPHGPVLEPPSISGYHASSYAGDASGGSHPPTSMGFRPSEALPPPSSLTGWRPADSMVPPGNLPPIPPPPPGPVRPPSMEPTAGWAAVNAAQTSKRPFEEQRPSSYESPASGSPKRPKLAPIMPRSNCEDSSGSYVPSSIPHTSASDPPFTSRSRAPSDSSQSHSQILPTPSTASGSVPGRRFIISTQDADSQASWRPEGERMMHMHAHGRRGHGPHGPGHGHGHGRGRGRGHRGRGRRGRGGTSTSNPAEQLELATPEWEKPGFTGSQASPNGYYNPMQQQAPGEGAGAAVAPIDRENEFPATPLAVQGPYDPFTAGHPESSAQQTSAGKKTRTKPIRNAEGVLIRKDGRPDMRSVSSANNLRKVHAKKEAERAEMDGRTPTSGRSLAPAGSNPMSEDEDASASPGSHVDEGGDDDHETQDGDDSLMSKIYPSNTGSRAAAERFFPRQDGTEAGASEETSEERDPAETEDAKKAPDSQMTDVEMREMSEAQAEDHSANQADTKMSTVNEAAEDEEMEKEK